MKAVNMVYTCELEHMSDEMDQPEEIQYVLFMDQPRENESGHPQDGRCKDTREMTLT